MASRSALARVINDYCHDLAFGLFPGAVLAAWLLVRGFTAAGLGTGSLERAASALWLVMLGGLTVSILTGVIRLRYWKAPIADEALEAKAQMAAMKHTIFVLTQVLAAFALYFAV